MSSTEFAFPGKTHFYPILNVGSANKSFSELKRQLETWTLCGLSYYQLRAKSISPRQYVHLAQGLREACPRLHIIANDFAAEVLAYPELFSGLHLGQEDLLALELKIKEQLIEQSHKKNTFVLGISTHTAAQIKGALAKETQITWSYLALGPCYISPTKRNSLHTVLDGETLTAALKTFIQASAQASLGQPALVLIGGIQAKNVLALIQKVKAALPDRSFPMLIAAIEAAKEKASILEILEKIRTLNALPL